MERFSKPSLILWIVVYFVILYSVIMYYLLSLVYLCVLFVSGLSVFFLLKKHIRFGGKHLYLAIPSLGLACSIWLSTLAAKLGVSLKGVLYAFLLFNLIIGSKILYSSLLKVSSKRVYLGEVFKKAGLVVLIFFGSFYLSTVDIRGYGWNYYFSLTNGDTFAYLGHMDQLVYGEGEDVSIEYESGAKPIYQHAVSLRTAVVSHVAQFYSVLDVQPHQMFFIVLRAMISILILTSFWFLLNLGIPMFLACITSVALLLSNFYVHSVFQQFLSSSAGLVILYLTIGLVIALMKVPKSRLLVFIAGCSFGVYAIVSPEAHVFLIPSIVGIVLVSCLNHLRIKELGLKFIIAMCGYLTGSLLLLGFDLGKIIYAQATGALNGHPGDWIAQPNYIVQQMGLTMFEGNVPSERFIIISYVILLLLVLPSMVLISQVIYRLVMRVINKYSRSIVSVDSMPVFYLAFLNLSLIIGSLILYYKGRGYALLKFNDYHGVLILPVIVTIIWHLTRRFEKKYHDVLLMLLVIVFYFYTNTTVMEKIKIFNKYESFASLYPGVGQILDEFEGRLSFGEGYVLDLPLDFADLVVYGLRDHQIKLYTLRPSYRYSFSDNKSSNYVIRGNMIPFFDINRPLGHLASEGVFEIILASNYIFVNDAMAENTWLPAECTISGKCFRWISREAEFEMLQVDSNKTLYLTLSKGPDFLSENEVGLQIGDNYFEIDSNLLNGTEFTFSLAGLDSEEIIMGSILVEGPENGIRQLSVSNMYIM